MDKDLLKILITGFYIEQKEMLLLMNIISMKHIV